MSEEQDYLNDIAYKLGVEKPYMILFAIDDLKDEIASLSMLYDDARRLIEEQREQIQEMEEEIRLLNRSL